MAFEQLGPTFVKLGQLLATRPDLIPTDFVEEFRKLQHQVAPISFQEIEKVLTGHFGQDLEVVFESFDQRPLAAASIAQVHRAVLRTGEPVVVKVQRPGIGPIIQEDTGVLYTLADLIEKYVPEARPYNPVGIVDEFTKNLALETNFIVEANNIRRFAENFSSQPEIKIPHVYREFTGRKVLVMEELQGIPLSQRNALDQEGINPELVLKRGLKAYLKMVFSDGLFHGDLHAGNMFVLPDNRIGLIDFGMVGRLNRKTQSAIANMLLALAEEDYDRLAYSYIDLAPFTEQSDVDVFARQLRDLIAPYFGLTMKHMNVGRLLLDSTGVAARQGLVLPADLVLFFKSIVTIEGMGRIIVEDFDFLQHSLQFADELVKSRYEPQKIAKDLSFLARDMNVLLSGLPRQIRQSLRKFNSPEYASKIEVRGSEDFLKTLRSGFALMFLGLILGSLILGSSLLLSQASDPQSFWLAIGGLGLSIGLGIFSYLRGH